MSAANRLSGVWCGRVDDRFRGIDVFAASCVRCAVGVLALSLFRGTVPDGCIGIVPRNFRPPL
jgi:hypothetical protein